LTPAMVTILCSVPRASFPCFYFIENFDGNYFLKYFLFKNILE
jgi:hypothetical protein